jgi:hypothetical protein
MLADWYAKHTHRANLKPNNPWLACRLISVAHPLYGRSKGSHENVTHEDGINHICLKRDAEDALCYHEFKLQVKKQRDEQTARPSWARGASFHSSLVASHNCNVHGIETKRRKVSKQQKAIAVADCSSADEHASNASAGPMDAFAASPVQSATDKRRGRQKLKQMLFYVYSRCYVSSSTFNEPEFREMLHEGASLVLNSCLMLVCRR